MFAIFRQKTAEVYINDADSFFGAIYGTLAVNFLLFAGKDRQTGARRAVWMGISMIFRLQQTTKLRF